jgi:hypothetical protein
VNAREGYLVPRRVVARAEIMQGIGITEFGLLVAAAAVGFGAQWVVGFLGHLLGGRVWVVVPRVLAAVVPPGLVWLTLRPAVGGRVLDYALAMLRYYRGGQRPLLWERVQGAR